MTHLKVHAHFAGLGWLALTLMGLTYKLLPLELGAEHVLAALGSGRQRADQCGVLGSLLQLCLRLARAAHRLSRARTGRYSLSYHAGQSDCSLGSQPSPRTTGHSSQLSGHDVMLSASLEKGWG